MKKVTFDYYKSVFGGEASEEDFASHVRVARDAIRDVVNRSVRSVNASPEDGADGEIARAVCLEIDYLGGEPGIYSARYLGEDTSYDVKNKALLGRLEGVPDEKRTARFVCAVAAAFPDRETVTVRGTIEGRIGYAQEGENGFGYDPIFVLPERGCTTAQLDPVEKNRISHRGRALKKIKPVLEDYFGIEA